MNTDILCYIFVTDLIKFVRESVYGRFYMFYTIYIIVAV